jgi:hypothetical protein
VAGTLHGQDARLRRRARRPSVGRSSDCSRKSQERRHIRKCLGCRCRRCSFALSRWQFRRHQPQRSSVLPQAKAYRSCHLPTRNSLSRAHGIHGHLDCTRPFGRAIPSGCGKRARIYRDRHRLSYATRSDGWIITGHEDITMPYAASCRRQLRADETQKGGLVALIGASEFAERLAQWRSKLAAIGDSLLQRELFVAVPSPE